MWEPRDYLFSFPSSLKDTKRVEKEARQLCDCDALSPDHPAPVAWRERWVDALAEGKR